MNFNGFQINAFFTSFESFLRSSKHEFFKNEVNFHSRFVFFFIFTWDSFSSSTKLLKNLCWKSSMRKFTRLQTFSSSFLPFFLQYFFYTSKITGKILTFGEREDFTWKGKVQTRIKCSLNIEGNTFFFQLSKSFSISCLPTTLPLSKSKKFRF